MKKLLSALALATASAVALSGCTPAPTTSTPSEPAAAVAQDITFWLIGGDTPQELRDYLKTTYKEKNGGNLTIEEQTWGDIIAKLTTSMPDANNTPDVTEIGNTQSPTFTNVGAFADISDMYAELGGDKLLKGFVEVGAVDGKNFTLPYYFGSRLVFYRKDVWKEAGAEVPKTLDEFNATVKAIAEKNPKKIKDFSGFFIGGQDWRNGISWVFANGGELAKKDGAEWVSTLSDPNTIKGLTQLQEIHKSASNAPSTARDASPWLYLNDSDAVVEEEKVVEETSLSAATIMAPPWASGLLGDLEGDSRVWNDEKFGVMVLPGNDGKPAPVFAGGSNLGISAKSTNQEGARDLLRIIFSAEYQQMLAANGLGPANSDYVSALGDTEIAKATVEAALASKLTPAAPGWAAVEASLKLEEFFAAVAEGGDIAALAAEYDAAITPLLNGK